MTLVVDCSGALQQYSHPSPENILIGVHTFPAGKNRPFALKGIKTCPKHADEPGLTPATG
ncbi:MAG: hypothetical protein HZA89_11940 [Verrucomicrobia bacterium]|nr:hypothetical protein [Verrucomicrobiota bacterium]